MAKLNGFIIYEDWARQFINIPSKDFKKFFLAVADYFFYDAEPPTFSGVTEIIAGFVFSQLRRAKASRSDEKRGGLRSAELAESRTTSDFLPQDPTKGATEGATEEGVADEGEGGTDAPSTHLHNTHTNTNTTTSSTDIESVVPRITSSSSSSHITAVSLLKLYLSILLAPL